MYKEKCQKQNLQRSRETPFTGGKLGVLVSCKQTKGRGRGSKRTLVKSGCGLVPQLYPEMNYREADFLPVLPSTTPTFKAT